MLANNTSIRHLFNKVLRDYDKLMGVKQVRWGRGGLRVLPGEGTVRGRLGFYQGRA